MANEVSIIIRARDFSQRTFDAATARAGRLEERLNSARTKGMAPLAAAGLSLGPAIIPVLAVATAGALATGAAFAGAGAALGVFKAVATETHKEVQEQNKEFETLNEKIEEYGQKAKIAAKAGDVEVQKAALKAQTAAQGELNAKLAELEPGQRKAVQGYSTMKASWKSFIESNKPATFDVLGKGYKLVGDNVGALQPLFDVGAKAVGKFLDAAKKWADGGGLKGMVDFLAKQGSTALPILGRTFANIGRGLGDIFSVVGGSGASSLGVLERMSKAFATWAAGDSFTNFMAYAKEVTPQVGEFLKSLATNVFTLVQILTPFAPLSFAIAMALSKILEAIPLEVLQAMVAAWLAYSVAMRAYGAGLLIAEVATKALAGAMKILNLAMRMNPIGIVITAIALLVAGLIALWKNSQKAREIMSTAFDGIVQVTLTGVQLLLKAYQAMANGILNVVAGILDALGKIPGNDWADRAADEVRGFKDSVNESFNKAIRKTDEWKEAAHKLPKRIRLEGDISDLNAKINRAKARLKEKGLTDPARAKIKADIAQLQARVRAAKASLASLTGKTVHVNVVTTRSTRIADNDKATGGVVGAATGGARGSWTMVGEQGRELVKLPYGSQVTPHGATENIMRAGGGGGGISIEIRSGGSRLDDLLVEILRKSIRSQGGNVQAVLGRD